MNNVKRVNKKLVPKGTIAGVTIYQDSADEKLYYKDKNGRAILITAPADVTVVAGTGITINEISGLGYREYEIVSDVTGSWDLAQTAFVDASYTGGAGVIGDGNQPFTSVSAANASGASYIYLKPGNHSLIVESNKTYYAAPGAIGTTVTDSGETATNVKILGDLTVTAEFGFNFTGAGSDVYAEVLEVTGRSCAWLDDNSSLTLKVKKGISTSCNNGGTYSCRQYGGKLDITTPYYYSNYTLVSQRAARPEFILRCPDIQILDGGYAGNVNKSPMLSANQVLTAPSKFTIDLMGGSIRNLNAVASVTNAIPDSILYNGWSAQAYACETTIKNGNAYAGANRGLFIYNNDSINHILNFSNLNVTSDIQAIESSSRGVAVGNVTVKIQDCNFISGAQMTLGNNSNFDFLRSTLQALGTSTQVFNFDATGATYVQTFRFKDSYFLFQTPGTAETFTGFAPATLGLLNSYSTEVLGAGAVDGWAGFTQVPTLTLPNII